MTENETLLYSEQQTQSNWKLKPQLPFQNGVSFCLALQRFLPTAAVGMQLQNCTAQMDKNLQLSVWIYLQPFYTPLFFISNTSFSSSVFAHCCDYNKSRFLSAFVLLH